MQHRHRLKGHHRLINHRRQGIPDATFLLVGRGGSRRSLVYFLCLEIGLRLDYPLNRLATSRLSSHWGIRLRKIFSAELSRWNRSRRSSHCRSNSSGLSRHVDPGILFGSECGPLEVVAASVLILNPSTLTSASVVKVIVTLIISSSDINSCRSGGPNTVTLGIALLSGPSYL